MPTFYSSSWTSPSTSSSVGNTVLYTGRELDPETGLYYYRARYYTAGLGRFIGRDPKFYHGGMNLYRYCTDNPAIRTDPKGTNIADYWSKLWGESVPKAFGVATGGLAQTEVMGNQSSIA